MKSALVPRDRGDFHIAILCALSLEAECMIDALDQIWRDDRYNPLMSDDNCYTLGAIGEHNVVIVHMSGMGMTRATAAFSNYKSSYPEIRLTLVVGICGGMPTGVHGEEILLGDVVISKALVQYDFGKQYLNGFKRNINFLDTLGAPNEKVLGLVNKLAVRQHREELQNQTVLFLQTIQEKSQIKHPGLEHDILYASFYNHKHHKPWQCLVCGTAEEVCEVALNATCEDLGCEPHMRVRRQRILDPLTSDPKLVIHIGTMGCANTVLKSGYHRDVLARTEGIIAVEMEGAGVWRYGPSIVIKGVCDYADSHKRKNWQQYAAATGAACTKAFLLGFWAPVRRDHPHEQLQQCHRLLKITDYKGYKNNVSDRHPGTCNWVLQDSHFREWHTNRHHGLLWISAGSSCGKSVLAKYLIDSELLRAGQNSVCYFFFRNDNDEQNSLAIALCAILHQLFLEQPELLHHALRSWDRNGDRLVRELDELWWIFCAAVADESCRPVICVLDALDECSRDGCRQFVQMLGRLYAEPLSNKCGSSRVKFLLTSSVNDNLERDLHQYLSYAVHLRLHGEDKSDEICEDIGLVIGSHVHNLSEEFELSKDSREQLQRDLICMQHRTYLALNSRIEQVRSTYRNSLLPDEVRIDRLPFGAKDLYESKLGKIPEDQRHVACKILLLMVVVRRPLTIQALATALSLERWKDSTSPIFIIKARRLKQVIRDWFGHFLDIGGAHVYFIERAGKDFLLCPEPNDGYKQTSSSSLTWEHSLHNVDAHKLLANVCQRALAVSNGTDAGSAKGHAPFDMQYLVRYAAEYGAYHTMEALRRLKIVYRQVYFVRNLFTFGMDLQTLDPAGKSLLHHATDIYNLNIDYTLINFILDRGGLVQSADKNNMNCLQYAVLRDDTILLTILLKAGFKVNKMVNRNERPSLRLTDTSVKYRAESIDEGSGLTALHAAALFGRYESASFLLRHKALVSIVNQYGQAALHLAVGSLQQQQRHVGDMWEESEQMAGHVWDFDDQVELRCAVAYEYRTRIQIVLALCKASATLVHTKDTNGNTPLHVIHYARHAELTFQLVMTLLSFGADPLAKDEQGITPIHHAARYANVDCLRLLLETDEDLGVTDFYGRNVLHFAAQSGCQRMVTFILNSTPLNELHKAVDCHGQDALQIALYDRTSRQGGCAIEIVKILLRAGCQANRTNSYGQDALAHYITHNTLFVDSEVVVMLLEHGADPFFRDIQGCNLAHLLFSGNDEADLYALVALQHAGVSLLDLNKEGRSVLHCAAIAGSVTRSWLYHLSYCIKLDVERQDIHSKSARDYALEEMGKKRSINLFRCDRWATTMACFEDIAGINGPCACHNIIDEILNAKGTTRSSTLSAETASIF